MILSSGEIYFIGEYDVKTDTRSEYFKIGIVRHGGKDNRNSLDRLLEHQTGNPRRLEIVHVIEADAVEGIETSLHHMFSPHRVYGEWLKLDQKLFKEVVNQAEQLKLDMSQYKSKFEAAELLDDVLSIDGKVNPDLDAEFWYEKFSLANFRGQACDEVITEYKELRMKEQQEGKDVTAFLSVQTKAGRKIFDAEGFREKYPELYSKFSSSTKRIKGSFRPNTNNPKFKTALLLDIDPQLATKISSFRASIGDTDSLTMQSEVHNKFLEIESELAFAEWEKELAKVHLKNLCGSAEGINGVCSWKRTEVVEEKLDEKGLKEAFPAEVQEFISVGAESKAYILETRSAYKEG